MSCSMVNVCVPIPGTAGHAGKIGGEFQSGQYRRSNGAAAKGMML